jgi:hypothetical protein
MLHRKLFHRMHYIRDQSMRDLLHENQQKFEPKWYGSYQIMEKMLLGTFYRLQDPNGIDLELRLADSWKPVY